MNRLCAKLFGFALIIFLTACKFENTKETSEVVSIESLLHEMMDRDALAKTSAIPFRVKQKSSYSIKAVSPNKPGWFDNNDSRVFRIDSTVTNKEYIVMDTEGPGAIVRFWSAWNPQPKYFSNGTLRIYIDHSQEPQIEGSLEEIISSNKYIGEPLSQAVSPFLENGKLYAGHNLYFPITFNKHIKITYQKGDDNVDDALYFKIDYRQYDRNVKVESYEKGALESGKYETLLAKVKDDLMQFPTEDQFSEDFSMKGLLKAGDSIISTVKGNRAIKKLVVKLKANNLEQALRSTVIAMKFDGKSTVWVPIGDFFGTGYKISPYNSRYSTVDNNGVMSCYFPMPFQKQAKISIHNFGNEDVVLEKFNIYSDAWLWDKQSLYFHANWKNYADIKTAEKQDVNYINILGKGKHVGDVLTLFNDSYYWWGEGDDKIYIDNESFPSHFGTGTEDYYGYAWCSVVNFSTPFNAQPSGEGNRSPGMTVNSRWRLLDVMPFNTSYRFDMELWHWDNKIQMDYSPTVFWYGDKEATAGKLTNIEGVRLPVKHSERFEGEAFKIKQITGGEVITEAFLSYNWSARNHLFWRGIKKEDELEAKFYSEKERVGVLKAVFTHAPDYVIVDMYLNNQLVFENLNLYSKTLSLKEYIYSHGVIKKGLNSIKFVAKGNNKLSPKANKLGLDYIEIK